MRAPCAGVPEPSGRPLPSGAMELSQAAASCSLMGLPNFGASAAKAAVEASTSAAAMTAVLDIDMADSSLGIDAPARNTIDVIHWEGGDIGRVARRAAFGEELLARRLHGSALVGGAALQHHRLTAPIPRHAETGERLGQHRRLKRGEAPALAAVGGDFHLGDTAMPGIGEAADLVI